MKFLIKIVSIVLVLSLPLLAKGVATITALKGNVEIKSEAVSINATLGASLNEKDSVITADKSKAQIIFNDETIVTVGKNSNFSISKYIFDDVNEPVAEFSMIKGAMKAITGRIGKIAPQKFKVKTKTATIGIRGTNFTVISMEDGTTRAYCTYGAISATINSKVYSIKQGFYFALALDGNIAVKEFSANELKEMDVKSFGEKKPLKGTGADRGREPDNTVERFETVIIKDITEKAQDAVQTEDDETAHEDHHSEYNSIYEPYVPPVTVVTPANIAMSGSATNHKSFTNMGSVVSLNFASDGSSFDSTQSYVQALDISNLSGNGETDNWQFTLASIPTSFTAKDNFSTSFSSVTLTPVSGSTSVNAVLGTNSLQTTTDLVADDYMSWGSWNAQVSFESTQSGTLSSDSHDFSGLWVAGEATSASVVSALTGTSIYTGEYRAITYNQSVPVTESGTASLSIDFGLPQVATLTISGNANSGGNIGADYKYEDMAISGNTISGGTLTSTSVSTSISGSANGTFYGTEGKSVGGNFSINDGGTASVEGVYQVTEVIQ